jgi:AcrR family transcriptional regulator
MPKSRFQSRREDILDAAIEVMVDRGHAELSMDKVAKQLDISKGNITYHFPNKKIFVQSIFTRLMEESQADRQTKLNPYIVSMEERLRLKLEREFEILLQPKHDTRVWETLAYSTHDKMVGKAFEDLFSWYIHEIVDTVAPLRPDLAKQDLHDLSLFIVSLLRGLLIFVGSARSCDRREKLCTLAVDQIMNLVKFWPPGSSGDALR